MADRGTRKILTNQNALSTTAERVDSAAASPTRRSILIQNLDAAITVYWGAADTVTSATGGRLIAGSSVRLYTQAAVYMIAASGTPTVAITEEYD